MTSHMNLEKPRPSTVFVAEIHKINAEHVIKSSFGWRDISPHWANCSKITLGPPSASGHRWRKRRGKRVLGDGKSERKVAATSPTGCEDLGEPHDHPGDPDVEFRG